MAFYIIVYRPSNFSIPCGSSDLLTQPLSILTTWFIRILRQPQWLTLRRSFPPLGGKVAPIGFGEVNRNIYGKADSGISMPWKIKFVKGNFTLFWEPEKLNRPNGCRVEFGQIG